MKLPLGQLELLTGFISLAPQHREEAQDWEGWEGSPEPVEGGETNKPEFRGVVFGKTTLM